MKIIFHRWFEKVFLHKFSCIKYLLHRTQSNELLFYIKNLLSLVNKYSFTDCSLASEDLVKFLSSTLIL